MVGGIWRKVRALFVPGGGRKLSRSSPSAGKPRMKRLAVGLLALAALAALGLGVYGRFIRTPPPPPDTPRVEEEAIPDAAEFERRAKEDPVALYKACLHRYERDVPNGLSVTLVKRERVQGETNPPEEVIDLSVRGDIPDANGKHRVEVLMKWKSGFRSVLGSEIHGALYSEKPGAEGTDGMVVTWRPTAWVKSMPVPAAGPDAQKQSRYCIRDAGVYRGMLRIYTAWKQRKEAGTLKARYVGKEAVPQVDGRVCYIVERTCDSPEADAFELKPDPAPITDPKVLEREGFTRVRVMIDAETWMQVGSELYRPDGTLLASYYFRNPNTNPTFAADTFTKDGLKRK